MAILLPSGKFSSETITGAPLVGGKVYAYVPNTSTPKDTYTTVAESVQNPHPVILDARGEATIYWSGSYDVILKDANGATIWGPERLQETGSADDLEARLADPTSASNGDAMVAVLKTATGSQATTQHEVNEREYDLYDALTPTQKSDYRTAALSLDLTVRLQAAFDSGASVVRMRPGKAKTTAKLVKPNTVRIKGDSCYTTQIVAAHNGTIMECSGVSLVGDTYSTLEDIGFARSGAFTPAIGLLLNNVNQPSMKRIRFEAGLVNGLQLVFALNGRFEEISFSGLTGIGLYIFSTGLDNGNNRNTYKNFNINSCGKGIRIDGTGTILSAFDDIGIETCTTALEVVNGNNIVFNRLYLEANTNGISLLGGDKITFTDGTNVSAQQWIATAGFAATRVAVRDLYDLSAGGILVNPNVMVYDFGQIRYPSTAVASSNANTLDAFANGVPWTPGDASGAALTFTLGTCVYTRLGDTVHAFFDITWPVTASGADNAIGGLPFPSTDAHPVVLGLSTLVANSATHGQTLGGGNSTFQFKSVTNTTPTNANLSGIRLTGTVIYRV